MVTQVIPQSPAKNRIFLLLLIGLFVLPLAAAWLLVGQWRPGGTVNHGELLTPARTISDFQLRRPDGSILSEAYLQGRWTLAYLAGAPCEERCRKGLYNIRQIRLALGKDMLRAQTLFIASAAPDAGLLDGLNREHTALAVGVADRRTADFLLQAFPDGAAGDWIYLIDPLGNLVMRYGVEDNPKGILEDLRRLLKYSKIG